MTLPSPKQRFLLSDAREPHQKFVHSEVFARAADAAMLEMQQHLPHGVGSRPEMDAMANCWRMEGARQFRTTLEQIADEPVEQKPVTPKFNHRDP